MQQNKVGEQKLYKLLGHFSLVFLLVTSLSASSFEDFKRSQSAAFTQYSDKNDQEFKNYLEAQWQEYNAQKTLPLYEKPKPKNIPSTISIPVQNVGPKISVLTPIKEEPKEQDKDSTLVDTKVINNDISFDFYGTMLGFNIDEKIKSATYYPQNQEGISNFFDVVASSEYEHTVTKIRNIVQEMKLNDWGVYLLVSQLSHTLYSSKDSVNLFQWFMFNKLGYAVKVGLSNRHIVVMYLSKSKIYATPSYTFGDKKYYVIKQNPDDNAGMIYSYPNNYPGADKALDLSLSSLPELKNKIQTKKLSFKQHGITYSIDYKYNKNLIDFMSTYPQADYETFFNTPLESQTYEELARGIKEHIDGMQASRAINFVLNFVQNAFKYKTDNEQFGYEKVMFAQETLYYEMSDCEDRAVLFSNLIKNIFKISVVGVKYSDHMATALNIPIDGDSVHPNGRRFVLADPTYINANIGQSMPRYKSKRPESFIVLKN